MDLYSASNQSPGFWGAYAGGLVATLTPCVYPLIPITLSIVGAGKESSRSRAIFRSLLFCLGIFISYGMLGLLAVSSGSFFGSIWSLAYFKPTLGLAIFCYSLISLDLIFLKTEGRISQAASRLSGNSPFGAFAAGAVSGILAAPCTGALLATILTLAATSANPISGVALLLAYAAGFSTPFFLLSISPQAFNFIPRSGAWLYGAKFLIGCSLLALGLYYMFASIASIIAQWLINYKVLIYVLGILIAFITCLLGIKSYQIENKYLRFLSAIVLALALVINCSIALNSSVSDLNKLSKFSQNINNAQSRKVPIVLEFTADWCVKCKEIARDVLSNQDVILALSETEFIQVDLDEVSGNEKEIQRRYQVRGLPSIIFLCPSGKELSVTRVNGEIEVKEFINRLNLAKKEALACN